MPRRQREQTIGIICVNPTKASGSAEPVRS